MAWQQDLHQLEQDLAAGRLSAEDYRRRRDELLAAANNEQNFGGGQQQPQQPQQPQQQPQPPGQQTPFPPAFRWGGQSQQPQDDTPAVERTQTIRPVGKEGGGSGEATQVVSGVGRPADADRTQAVRVNPNSGFGQQPQQQAPPPPWQSGPPRQSGYTEDNTNAPAWAVNDAFGEWPKQGGGPGSDVFASTGGSAGGGKGKKIALIVIIVVVVAGLGVGGWLVFGKGSSQAGKGGNTGPTTTHSAPPTTPAPRAAIGSLVSPPGFPSSQSFTPATLATKKPLPQPDLDILSSSTLSKADYVASQDGSTVLDLWAFTMQDATAAQGLAQAFNTDQQRFAFTATNITTGDQGQYVAYTTQQKSTDGQTIIVYRLHYVVGNQVIRVEAYDNDGAKAKTAFLKLLKLQTQLTPPAK